MKKTPELTIVEQAEAFLEARRNPVAKLLGTQQYLDALDIIEKLLKEIEDLDSVIDGLYEQAAGESI